MGDPVPSPTSRGEGRVIPTALETEFRLKVPSPGMVSVGLHPGLGNLQRSLRSHDSQANRGL